MKDLHDNLWKSSMKPIPSRVAILRRWWIANWWLVLAVVITAGVWAVIMFAVAGWWTA